MVSDSIPTAELTPRQREVLDLLARGYTNGQVADALGISLDGAKWHVSEVITKLGVDTREEAAEHWRRERGIARRLRDFPRRMSARALGWWAAAAGTATAGVTVALAVVAFNGGASGAAPTGRQRLPDPPIPARSTAVMVWTGEEVLVVGGDTYLCHPLADCIGPDYAALSDGAAYDPETNQWRTIADSPVPIHYASTAVVGGSVYFLASVREDGPTRRTEFVRYTIATDTWEELDALIDEIEFGQLVASGDNVVVVMSTHERGQRPDRVFDTTTSEWSELPPDPLAPAFDRTMFEHDGDLWLLARNLVPNPGSERPALAQLARFDVATATWEHLPETGMLYSLPLLVSEGHAYFPSLGGADGGEVNNWGRTYPNGGVINLTTGAWTELSGWSSFPDDQYATGAFGSDSATYTSARGDQVFDTVAQAWVAMEPLDGGWYVERPAIIAAGRDAIVVGGADWTSDSTPTTSSLGSADGELLGDAWIWRAPD